MSLEKILDGIESKAQEEAKLIHEKANEEAKSILAKGKIERSGIVDNLIKEKIELYKKEAEKKISQAKLNSRKKILMAKQKIIDETFQEVNKELNKLDDKSYLDWIKNQIVKYYENQEEQILISKHDELLLTEEWKDQVSKELSSKGIKNTIKFKIADNDFHRGFKIIHPQYELTFLFGEMINALKEEDIVGINKLLFDEKI